MSAKLISKQTASNEVDVSAKMSEVVSEWISDYDAVSAELKPAKRMSRSGKLVNSNSEFVLILDGEPTEISYGFYRIEDGSVMLDVMHNHDE